MNSEKKSVELPGRPIGRVFFLIFVLLAASIVIAGWFYTRKSAQHYRAEVERQLSAIADLKVGELTQFRKQRLADGSVLFHNAPLSALVRRILEKSEDADAERQLLSWLGKYQDHHDYDEVSLLDTQGVCRLSLPAGLPAASSPVAKGISNALQSGQVTFQDFYRSERDRQIHLGILVPVLDEQDANRPLGVFVLRIDPTTYLYPFIQRWPTPARTAETLLVRRDDNNVVYLNVLRHLPDTALILSFPMERTELPAVSGVLGQSGIMRGEDYRGLPVLADVRAVPNSPWFLIAKIDIAEVDAPMWEHLWQVVAMIGVLIFSAGACVWLVWRKQSVRFYRENAETENEAARMVTVVRDSNDAITIQDFEGRITAWNHGAELMYGYSEAEALAMSIERLTAPGKVDEQKDFVRRLIVGEAVTSLETLRVTKDGRILDVWMTVTKLVDKTGKPIGIASTERDTTARKQAMEEVHRLNAELEQRVVERTAELDAANKELEAFSYSVSHDLRAPLRHVQGYVDMLGREAENQLSENGRRYMKTIEDASREMGVLIDDLLAFSRTGRAQMAETTVSLNGLVQESIQSLEMATRGRNIVWTLPPLPTVQGDPAMLRLVLANLLGNAVKFTRPRDPAVIEVGIVNVEVREKDEGQKALITFFVRDNGVGFDPQYVHKLFGVFQRLHRADEFEGTGIGLANVRRIIVRHGGCTWAAGAVDKGATFFFTLKPSTTTNPVNGKDRRL